MTSQYTNFNIYITKILKMVHPGANLKNSSRSLLNKFLVDLSLRLNASLAKHTVTEMNKNVNKAIAMRKKGESVTNKTFSIPITRSDRHPKNRSLKHPKHRTDP